MMNLSPAETAFVEALIELGDVGAASATSGVQPSLARDPRIQSAIVDLLRDYGAADAARARKTLYDLALKGDNDGVRLRAAQALWERGLGKVPETVHITHEITALPRDALYREIHSLVRELGLPSPETIEAAYVEIEDDAPSVPKAQAPVSAPDDPALGEAECASVAQPVEREGVQSPEVPGSIPGAGTTGYVPPIPTRWR